MTLSKSRHITEFRWKLSIEGEPYSIRRWKTLLASSRRRGTGGADSRSAEHADSRRLSAGHKSLPGKFPGANSYMAVPGSVSRGRSRLSLRVPAYREREQDLSRWCPRSFG